jgi:hypothetical protein
MLKHRVILLTLAALLISLGSAQAQEWEQIWNGKDLTGWNHIGYGRFIVDEGVLKTEGVDRTLGLLYYKEPIGNCTLRVVYKEVGERSNSGVYIRIPKEPTSEQEVVRIAHEIQIGGRTTGEIFGVTRVLTPPPVQQNEWNTMEITIEGSRTVVTVNGVLVTDYTQGVTPMRENVREYYKVPRPDEGWFGLQNHNLDIVWFKEVAIRRNPKK